MIDHVLGRPSTQFRKYQVFVVVSFWCIYLLRGNKHGPPGIRLLSSKLGRRATPWQTTLMGLLTLYVSRNFAKLMGLESPEPLANLYSRSYFRATWITTALDAGFWTAMKIKRPWLRDFASMVFSLYYLIAAEQADEKVRRVRATLTVEHLRVSWNKATTPYLSSIAKVLRPRLCKYPPVAIRIPRPRGSSYSEPALGWLYFNGPLSALRDQTNLVLDIPGGGFVAMNPRTADDKLLAWAGKTGVPVLSLDYKKAPEYPYPYALNECYDVYHTIVTTRGRCLGLSGNTCPKIVLTGDSAGGNLAAGLTLMILQSRSTNSRKWAGEDVLPPPAGLVLIYPSLDMNIGSWMTEEQLSLIRDRGMRKTNRNILRRKSEDYYSKLTPAVSAHFEEKGGEDQSVIRDYFSQQHGSSSPDPSPQTKDGSGATTASSGRSSNSIRKPVPDNVASKVASMAENQPHRIHTRLAVSSMISYFNDRILTPEMMRAMIILYIGPYNRPDFSTDFLLSPVLAPEALLARFPKTYFLTGERDPLVDDTVIFAGRIRQAKLHQFRERQELGLEKSRLEFDEKEHVEVSLIPGISHGFVNFVSVFPEGWRQLFRCAGWIGDLFDRAGRIERSRPEAASRNGSGVPVQKAQKLRRDTSGSANGVNPSTSSALPTGRNGSANGSATPRHHRRGLTGESSGDEDRPLEMSMLGTSKSSTDGQQSQSPRSKFSRPPASLSMTPTKNHKKKDSSTTNGHAVSPADSSAKARSYFLPSTPNAADLNVDSIDSDFTAGPQPPAQTGKQRQQQQQLALQLPLSMSMSMSMRRDASFTSLPSEEDLLRRRMEGLAGGLMGIGEGAKTP